MKPAFLTTASPAARPARSRRPARAAGIPVAAALLTAALAAGLAQSATAASLAPQDAAYITTAIGNQLGLFAEAKVASQKATDPKLRAFASRIANEAAQTERELAKIAASSGVEVPKTPPLRESSHYDELASTSGKGFDAAFLHDLKIDLDIDAYNEHSEQRNGVDAELRRIAGRIASQLSADAGAMRTFSR